MLRVTVYANCDACTRQLTFPVQTNLTPGDERYSPSINKMSDRIRAMGWSVGKSVVCPECKARGLVKGKKRGKQR